MQYFTPNFASIGRFDLVLCLSVLNTITLEIIH